MTLADFKILIRSMVPSANKQNTPDILLEKIINKGVREVNFLTAAYVDEKYFNVTAEAKSYDIRDSIDDFIGVGPGGLWLNKGTADSPNWQQLDGVTRAFLNKQYPNWPNITSGNTLMYFTESGKLIVYPAASSALANGFWFPDYIKKPATMTDDTHYPFTGSDQELADLEILDDAIIDYVRWHLKHAVGSDQKGLITRQEFEKTVRERKIGVKRRLDIAANQKMRVKIRQIC